MTRLANCTEQKMSLIPFALLQYFRCLFLHFFDMDPLLFLFFTSPETRRPSRKDGHHFLAVDE